MRENRERNKNFPCSLLCFSLGSALSLLRASQSDSQPQWTYISSVTGKVSLFRSLFLAFYREIREQHDLLLAISINHADADDDYASNC